MMKRLFIVVGSLLVLPAFAEVAPQIVYDENIEFIDDFAPAIDEPQAEQSSEEIPAQATQNNSSPRTVQSARTAGRATQRGTISGTQSASPRVSSSRNISARSGTGRATVARNGSTTVSARQPANAGRTTVARAVRLTGGTTPLYTPNTVTASTGTPVASRVSIRNVGTRTASNTAQISSTAAIKVSDSLDNLQSLTERCTAQYTACMDNYCNVLDDNQGRCSCSANLTNYLKTEEALREAQEALQDVAQQIQYIGLSADDVETLFTETEAELKLSSTNDTTDLKNSLDKIKKMIIDVKSGTASASTVSSGFSFDLSGLLDFSIDSTGFDLSSILNSTNTANTSSISNQRGANLYKTATARCKASVLNTCSAEGVDPSMITNAYDLEIDKSCLAYERALTDANDNMTATVRNAKSVLQRARLMVAQNKNQYDLRGCVEALDSCMQSDFVCGSDYEGCLDPTGKYIVNGSVVTGSQPGQPADVEQESGLYKDIWSTAWASTGTLADYVKGSLKTQEEPSSDLAEYLQYKIGYAKDGKSYGMCMSVLNQCQNYTYKDGDYNPKNQVVAEYLQRSLMQIKASQDEILADYAENCVSDVQSCLSSNYYNAGTEGAKNIAINSCRTLIKTCMSVNGDATDGAGIANETEWSNKVMTGIIK